MPLLEDNTVIPSYMGVRDVGVRTPTEMFDNFALRLGEVREIIKSDDNRNVSGKFTEYTVEAGHMSDGTTASLLYYNVTLLNTFGALADQLRYTLRTSDMQQSPEDGINVGAKVLLMCVDGKRSQAIIVGGVRDQGTDRDGKGYQGTDDPGAGHNLFFEFNGVQATVNKDGELTVMFRGATDVKGKLLSGSEDSDDQAAGSKIFMKKDGSVRVSTKDDKEFVNIDHNSGKIEIEASDNVTIKSKGTLIGDASDKMLLAETYRSAEDDVLQAISDALTSIATALGTVSAGTTPPTTPGIAADVLKIAAASVQIAAFKAKGTTFLSKKNKND